MHISSSDTKGISATTSNAVQGAALSPAQLQALVGAVGTPVAELRDVVTKSPRAHDGLHRALQRFADGLDNAGRIARKTLVITLLTLGALGTPAQAGSPSAPVPITVGIVNEDPLLHINDSVNAVVDSFKNWNAYPYAALLVPGYTPAKSKVATPGVHKTAHKRLEHALRAFQEGKAPFVIVSGGAVYPEGTPYTEGIEMKKALVEMGVPADRIIVEGRARHTTTNLRNSGRYMLEHGMQKALIVTGGGGFALFDQAFYVGHPKLSSFAKRCKNELGYVVGDIHRTGKRTEIAFTPSTSVLIQGTNDPLDP